ncbi:MAG: glycosyltransferase [Planctomycetales bacterium]|nr:glycosyltransferase [Planctomycetales bacterium]
MIAERFPPDLGGVARSAFRTAHAAARLGWDVHVVAWTKTLPPGEVETLRSTAPSNGEPIVGGIELSVKPSVDQASVDQASVDNSSADNSGVTVHRLGLFANWDFSMQHTTNVLEWLHQQFDYTAAWGHYVYPSGYMAVVFAETVGIPSTVSARGNDIDRLMFPPGDFARLMWTLQRATVVSCVSQDLAAKVQMLLGDPIEVVVLPNVVDTDIFAPKSPSTANSEIQSLRNTLGIDDDEVVLGFCGELRHKKGLPFLLSALVHVRQDRPACLVVIGEVRPRERAHLAAFATEHPEAAERILVTGSVDSPHDVARHFRICDVVLQPSVWDGMPNAVLEAMACGKLVIASDAGGIPEAIEHGVSGFVIPKAQLHLLGTAVLEVVDLSPHHKQSIATAARVRIEQHFQHGAESQRLSKLLRRLRPIDHSSSSYD